MRKIGPSRRPRRSRKHQPARASLIDRCLYCDRPLALSQYDQPDKLTLDHIIPKQLGGSGRSPDHPNVALCCLECNGKKANHTASEAMALGLIPKTERATSAEQAAIRALGRSYIPDTLKE